MPGNKHAGARCPAAKERKARERKLAEKERNLRIAKERDLKACTKRHPRARLLQAPPVKNFQQRSACILAVWHKLCAGKAALAALVAKFEALSVPRGQDRRALGA